MKKLAFAAALALSTVMAHADRAVDEIYPRSCGVCHAAGVAGAPKTGDAAAWQARADAKGGIDNLIGSVKVGLNAMPPRGMCNDCTDSEYKTLIEYMMKGA